MSMFRRKLLLLGSVGGGGGGGAGPPLDDFTTNLAGAYSTRRLLTSYTGNLIRVRRDGGSPAEADIGYDGSGDLDATALAAHVGTDSGFIVTYYDQSGNGRDVTQSTAGTQFRIRNAGTNHTHGGRIVGQPINDGGGAYVCTAFTAYTGTTMTGIAVWKWTSTAQYARVLGMVKDTSPDYDNTGRTALLLRNDTNAAVSAFRNGTALNSLAVSNDTAYAVASRYDGTNHNLRQGSNTDSEASSASFDVNRIILAGEAAGTGKGSANAPHCEFVVWTGDIGDSAVQTILGEQRTYWTAS